MDAPGREKRVTFKVADLAVEATDLARWAHGQHAVEPGTGELPTATVYYKTTMEAQKLYAYLVRHAACDDKVAWQQDRAHLEIQGWCQLCEAANQGECRGWCLLDLTSKAHPDSPSFWPADCQDENNEGE